MILICQFALLPHCIAHTLFSTDELPRNRNDVCRPHHSRLRFFSRSVVTFSSVEQLFFLLCTSWHEKDGGNGGALIWKNRKKLFCSAVGPISKSGFSIPESTPFSQLSGELSIRKEFFFCLAYHFWWGGNQSYRKDMSTEHHHKRGKVMESSSSCAFIFTRYIFRPNLPLFAASSLHYSLETAIKLSLNQ